MVWYYVSQEIKVFIPCPILLSICLTSCWQNNFLSKITPRYFTFSTSFIIWLSTLTDSAADEVPKTMNSVLSELSFKEWHEK